MPSCLELYLLWLKKIAFLGIFALLRALVLKGLGKVANNKFINDQWTLKQSP